MIWICILLLVVAAVCGFIAILCYSLGANEKAARLRGIKVGALLVPLFFVGGCASGEKILTRLPTVRCELPHATLDIKSAARASCEIGMSIPAQTWGSTSPTNSPICR